MRVSAALRGIIDKECDIMQKALPLPAAQNCLQLKAAGEGELWKELAGSPDFPTSAADYWSFHT